MNEKVFQTNYIIIFIAEITPEYTWYPVGYAIYMVSSGVCNIHGTQWGMQYT